MKLWVYSHYLINVPSKPLTLITISQGILNLSIFFVLVDLSFWTCIVLFRCIKLLSFKPSYLESKKLDLLRFIQTRFWTTKSKVPLQFASVFWNLNRFATYIDRVILLRESQYSTISLFFIAVIGKHQISFPFIFCPQYKSRCRPPSIFWQPWCISQSSFFFLFFASWCFIWVLAIATTPYSADSSMHSI